MELILYSSLIFVLAVMSFTLGWIKGYNKAVAESLTSIRKEHYSDRGGKGAD